MHDHAVAELLARQAMGRLLALRRQFVADGVDPRHWGAAADMAANDWLLTKLAEHRPDDAVLSEESPDSSDRLTRSRVWIIDPLDGTREYAEPARSDWAVHVALSVDGSAHVGAVALPDGTVLSTGSPEGPAPEHAPGGPQPASGAPPRLRLVLSRSRPPALAELVAEHLNAELVPLGSAGAKVAAVVRGDAELYVHDGGMNQWDSCAPVAVALAAGFHASRIDGSPLRYNGPEVNLPDLLVCRPELAGPALAAIAGVATAG